MKIYFVSFIYPSMSTVTTTLYIKNKTTEGRTHTCTHLYQTELSFMTENVRQVSERPSSPSFSSSSIAFLLSAFCILRKYVQCMESMLAMISDPEPMWRESDTWSAAASRTRDHCVGMQFHHMYFSHPHRTYKTIFTLLWFRSARVYFCLALWLVLFILVFISFLTNLFISYFVLVHTISLVLVLVFVH